MGSLMGPPKSHADFKKCQNTLLIFVQFLCLYENGCMSPVKFEGFFMSCWYYFSFCRFMSHVDLKGGFHEIINVNEINH